MPGKAKGKEKTIKAEKKSEIHRMIIDLSETTAEGLEHINSLTMKGYFEDTAEIFTDVTNSFHETERALIATMENYEESSLKAAGSKVTEAMQLMLLAYEGDSKARPMEIIQFTLLPAYRRWQKEMHETLGESAQSAYH